MKLFVWDFHGVLERHNDLALLDITNIILKKNKFKVQINRCLGKKLYGKRWYQYFEFLLPQESYSTHINLTHQCYVYNDSHPEITEKYIKVAKYAKEVLEKISKKHEMILVSNTNTNSLITYLKAINLNGFFPREKIFGTDSHRDKNTKTKKEYLEDYVRVNKGKFEKVIVIGDALEEMKMAESIRARFYLYAHRGKNFRDCPCENKITDLRDVLGEF
jgi:phosphoglycolate phosphatase-like HAD superfamily hydrolase